jgi:hypothetical protein
VSISFRKITFCEANQGNDIVPPGVAWHLSRLGKRRKEFGEAESLSRPSERARTSRNFKNDFNVHANGLTLLHKEIKKYRYTFSQR